MPKSYGLKLLNQTETGTPYILYKDACNKKSNQKNLGVIKSSNLCTEIVEYSSPDEYAVCNLASIGLPRFVSNGEFDFQMLHKVTKTVTRNLDKIIDLNFYPLPETKRSNMRHRPIGIGVQGLADVFAILKMPFDSKEANELNDKIFETIYYASVETSMEIAKERENLLKKNVDSVPHLEEEIKRDKYIGAYSTFEGSPISEGKLQFDLWGQEPSEEMKPKWAKLKKNIMKYGMREGCRLHLCQLHQRVKFSR